MDKNLNLQSTILFTEISDDKSQYLHQIIKTYSGYLDVRFSLVTAKSSEFDQYEDKSFLLTPTIKDPEKFINLLRYHSAEIDERKKNQAPAELLFILVDEYSDFMRANPQVVEDLFIKIAKEGQAVNIYLMATTVHGDDPKVLTSQLRECFKVINIDKLIKD